jgi:hypothetical protein
MRKMAPKASPPSQTKPQFRDASAEGKPSVSGDSVGGVTAQLAAKDARIAELEALLLQARSELARVKEEGYSSAGSAGVKTFSAAHSAASPTTSATYTSLSTLYPSTIGMFASSAVPAVVHAGAAVRPTLSAEKTVADLVSVCIAPTCRI